ncbi:MAG: hypothetical protein ACLP59_01125 [Bryobacteraceae bacterium]
MRAPYGEITTFDVPGAGTGPGQGTLPMGNNAWDEIEGYYVDASSVAHGFLRAPYGEITTFDAPDAGTLGPAQNISQGTFPMTNNTEGAISGFYIDQNYAYHGFVRIP